MVSVANWSSCRVPGASPTPKRTWPSWCGPRRSTATMTGTLSLLPPGFPWLRPPTKVSSSSTTPDRSSRSGRTIARRSFCSQAQAFRRSRSLGRPAAQCRAAVLLRRHEPDRREPRRQRGVRAVEDGAGRGGGLPATLSTHPQALGGPPPVLAGADRTAEAIGPSQPPEVLQAARVVGEPVPELLIGPRIADPRYWLLNNTKHSQSLLWGGGRGAGRGAAAARRRAVLAGGAGGGGRAAGGRAGPILAGCGTADVLRLLAVQALLTAEVTDRLAWCRPSRATPWTGR